jgi:hypothetical protein
MAKRPEGTMIVVIVLTSLPLFSKAIECDEFVHVQGFITHPAIE